MKKKIRAVTQERTGAVRLSINFPDHVIPGDCLLSSGGETMVCQMTSQPS